jgi:deoxyribodipyrimidine photo-lyase
VASVASTVIARRKRLRQQAPVTVMNLVSFVPYPATSMTPTLPFTPTRAEGLRRLNAFVARAGRDYPLNRNYEHGPGRHTGVSMLSPYLRHRLITEREVVAAVLAKHRYADAEKFIQEVMWRTYWKGWLEMRPAVWSRYEAALVPTDIDTDLLRAAEAGKTGVAGFDDWVRELVETGYLHNHARMWFASIWIFTLGLPWALGADFFLRHLIDADPASNTLSWRWVAGLHTSGKNYVATAGNIERYTAGRVRVSGLATNPAPISEGIATEAPMMPPETRRRNAGTVLLLITPEDLHPESLFAPDGTICGIVVSPFAAQGFGATSARFAAGAVADAAKRAAVFFGCDVTTVENLDAALLSDLARGVGATEVLTAYAPVGPIASALGDLSTDDLPLAQIRRSWDNRFWPHATKGYFPFKEQIPQLLIEEGLT